MAEPKQTDLWWDSPVPPDNDDRRRIIDELDSTMLVEAAAGTGKTTCLVGRMVALLARNKCSIEQIAAVTFTRKAAAQLRSRFQSAIESAQRSNPSESLKIALDRLDRCFIGTIHSFCARLLRERPIEAGVGLEFEELDEEADFQLRLEAWDEYVANLFGANKPLPGKLRELGLEVKDLQAAFLRFADYPDVEAWPVSNAPLPDVTKLSKALCQYVERIKPLVATFPDECGNDKLMPLYKRLVRMVRQSELARTAELMDILEECEAKSIVQKCWPGGGAQAKEEKELWDAFCDQVEPVLRAWREKRYPTVLEVLQGAAATYRNRRAKEGKLNFQDLLLRTRDVLRDNLHIRRYFRSRFQRLLVDEFQDTDPIQAEVMLFLTADDPGEKDWTKCVPRKGSLFVVGDPKQSIYRFRRADIVTYEQVKNIIQKCGVVVPLRANFRTIAPVLDWVNEIFDNEFPEQADDYSPGRCSMLVGRNDGLEGQLAGVRVLRIPEEHTKSGDIVAYEPELVARTIHSWIASKATVPRTRHELDDGLSPEASPGDFLIIARNKARLAYYAQALEQLGIPARVTGGSALGQIPELALLRRCLACIAEPDNPIALVAVLRSELFGFSDTALYEYKRSGGIFSYHSQVPDTLSPEIGALFEHAFRRIKQCESWARRLPLVPALERIAADLGLPARTAACQGNMQAGSLAKALEIVRAERSRFHSLADAVLYLDTLINGAGEWSTAEAVPQDKSAVQVMNLHKAKGLEAPVVFLADPTGEGSHAPDLHIDRTSGRALGHMVVLRGRSEMLACSPDWDRSRQIEELFEKAEEIRLRYVAATRAGSMLVISQREKNNHTNPWQDFGKYLEEQPALADPGLQQPALSPLPPFDGQQAEAARAMALNRLKAAGRPSYSVVAAKKIAVSGKLSPAEGEHGTEWGTVIHSLLQAALAQPEADLEKLAYDALHEQDPELVSLADLAVQTTQKVMRSQIWQRARASKQCLVEIPFETLLPVEEADAGLASRVLRGVIDLAFFEDGGWVIVDYKSDRKETMDMETLVDHYKDQVLLYARVWRRMAGQPVREVGLYFTHMDRYVAIQK